METNLKMSPKTCFYTSWNFYVSLNYYFLKYIFLTRVRHVVGLRKNIKVLNNNSNMLLNNDLRVVCGGGSVSCRVEFSPNFDLKNMISTYSKNFLWKKWPKFARFWDFFSFKSPDFCDKFQQVAKYIEGFSFFSTFISIMQPNLANLFCEWLPLWLHHKIL